MLLGLAYVLSGVKGQISKGAVCYISRTVVSDEACFGLVPEGVSYRSDYSYQKHICTIRSRV